MPPSSNDYSQSDNDICIFSIYRDYVYRVYHVYSVYNVLCIMCFLISIVFNTMVTYLLNK